MKNNIRNAFIAITVAFAFSGARGQTTAEAWDLPNLQIFSSRELASGNILLLARALTNQTLSGVSANIPIAALTHFIGKYDPVSNNWYWAKDYTISSNSQLLLAEDVNGNIFFAGAFTGTLTYDGGIAAVNSGTSRNGGLLMISASTGSLTWAYQEPATSPGQYNCLVHSLYCDGNSVFIGGSNSVQSYLTKVNLNGQKLWTSVISGNSQSQSAANGVVVDGSGNCYVTGFYWGNPTIGNLKFPSTKNQTPALFLAKYNGGGVLQWVKCVTVENRNLKGQNWYFTGIGGSNIAIDSNGDIYISGGYNAISGVNFGNNVSLVYNNYGNPHNNSAPSHCFLVKYNSSGIAQFAREIVSKKSNPFPLGNMFVSSNNNVFLYHPGGAGTDTLVYLGQNITVVTGNFAVSEFSQNGSYLGTIIATSTGTDGALPNRIITYTGNGFLVSGIFRGTVNFDSNTSLSATGTGTFPYNNGFLARYTNASFRFTNGLFETGEQRTKLTLFPNPITDMLRITSSQKIGEVLILDATGKVCRTYYCPENEAELNMEGLAEGVYFLKAEGSGEVLKVIKH